MAGKKKTAAGIVKSDDYAGTFHGEKTASASHALSAMPEYMYHNDPLARKIIDVIPEEMVTPGFGLDGLKDEKEFKSAWDAMKLDEKIIFAFAMSRLYGGSAIVAIINDRGSLKSPVRPGGVLETIRVYDKTKVKIGKVEQNPNNSRYGEAITYEISPGGSLQPYEVHYTRCHIIDGQRVTEYQRQLNGGWGQTVLVPKLIEAINDYNYCEELATQLLRRKQQAVWKAKNLAELCDDNEGEYAARVRLAQVDDNSGVGRTIGIDAEDEDFQVLNSDISGVDAFLDKKMDRIVNYSGIHEIILKNKNVGGVSASQNTALETFYKVINRKRGEDYRPLLEWLLPFMISEQEWSIRFDPLSVPSAKESAETLERNVNSVTLAVENQLIDLEEARDTLQAMSTIFKLKDSGPDASKMPVIGSDQIDPGAENEGDTPKKEKVGDDAGNEGN